MHRLDHRRADQATSVLGGLDGGPVSCGVDPITSKS
jgi:hypothetical protein